MYHIFLYIISAKCPKKTLKNYLKRQAIIRIEFSIRIKILPSQSGM